MQLSCSGETRSLGDTPSLTATYEMFVDENGLLRYFDPADPANIGYVKTDAGVDLAVEQLVDWVGGSGEFQLLARYGKVTGSNLGDTHSIYRVFRSANKFYRVNNLVSSGAAVATQLSATVIGGSEVICDAQLYENYQNILASVIAYRTSTTSCSSSTKNYIKLGDTVSEVSALAGQTTSAVYEAHGSLRGFISRDPASGLLASVDAGFVSYVAANNPDTGLGVDVSGGLLVLATGPRYAIVFRTGPRELWVYDFVVGTARFVPGLTFTQIPARYISDGRYLYWLSDAASTVVHRLAYDGSSFAAFTLVNHSQVITDFGRVGAQLVFRDQAANLFTVSAHTSVVTVANAVKDSAGKAIVSDLPLYYGKNILFYNDSSFSNYGYELAGRVNPDTLIAKEYDGVIADSVGPQSAKWVGKVYQANYDINQPAPGIDTMLLSKSIVYDSGSALTTYLTSSVSTEDGKITEVGTHQEPVVNFFMQNTRDFAMGTLDDDGVSPEVLYILRPDTRDSLREIYPRPASGSVRGLASF